MAFEVIPAIDVAGGRLARLTSEGPVPLDAHGGDPIAAARACLDAGARLLHVVDLDLAFTGEPRNADVLRAIVTLGARVQAAGAIVEDPEIAAVLEAGAERVVLGSAALNRLDETARLIERYGDRLVVGIEVDRDRIRARGRRTTDLPLHRTLSAVRSAGAARVVVTSVRRVSTMTGPDVGALAVAVRLGLPVDRGRWDRLHRRSRIGEGRGRRGRHRRPGRPRGPARPGPRDQVHHLTGRCPAVRHPVAITLGRPWASSPTWSPDDGESWSAIRWTTPRCWRARWRCLPRGTSPARSATAPAGRR